MGFISLNILSKTTFVKWKNGLIRQIPLDFVHVYAFLFLIEKKSSKIHQ